MSDARAAQRRGEPTDPRPMTEAALQAAVVHLARLLGYRVYHTAFAIGSDRGWPDVVLCRPPRLIVAEFKRTGLDPTAAQVAWLDDLAACGIETYVWRPTDWLPRDDGSSRIEELLDGASTRR